jgi:CheY-like chemotaxis protein
MIEEIMVELEEQMEMKAMRVLIVEDEKINAMVIEAMLGKIGHDVHLADNGRQALQKAGQQEFDLIFMDIQMPELDGLETTQAIRTTALERNRRVPIIALTAHAMKGDRERFMAAGMDGYLVKPVDINRLLEVLERFQGD